MSDNVIHLFRRAAFEPEALIILGDAYDRARQSLPHIPQEEIARAVIEIAQTGVRSPARLAEGAIQSIYAKGYPDHA